MAVSEYLTPGIKTLIFSSLFVYHQGETGGRGGGADTTNNGQGGVDVIDIVITVITIVIIKFVIPVIIIIKVANVILDNDDANDDDGEEFLIEEAPKDPMMSLEPDPEVEVCCGFEKKLKFVCFPEKRWRRWSPVGRSTEPWCNRSLRRRRSCR